MEIEIGVNMEFIRSETENRSTRWSRRERQSWATSGLSRWCTTAANC